MDILIVDDHMIIRRGLMQLLAEHPQRGQLGEAADGPSALAALRGARYDVVLLDIALGERDGLDVLKSIGAEFPGLGVVMLSVYPESQFAVRAIRGGARAYLNKGCSPDELFRAVSTVGAGGYYLPPATAALLAQNVRRDAPGAPHDALSNREMQVLRLLAQGRTVSEIARQLSLSVNTISTYRARVCDKLGARTAVDLFSYATRHSLCEN